MHQRRSGFDAARRRLSAGGIAARAGTASGLQGVSAVLDFVMIAAGVGFFVLAILYVIACENM